MKVLCFFQASRLAIGMFAILPIIALGQDDSCRDILLSGIHNTYTSVNKNQAKAVYRQALCDESSSLNKSGSNSGGGGSGFGISLNGGHSTENLSDYKHKYCNDTTQDMSNDDFDSLVSQTIDSTIVENWRMCMQSKGGGLFANADINGDEDIAIHVTWRGTTNLGSVLISGSPQLSGMACPNHALKDSTTLELYTVHDELCKRIGRGSATFIITTDHGGSRTVRIPPLPPLVQNTSTYLSQPSQGMPTNFGPVRVTKTIHGASTHLTVDVKAIPIILPNRQLSITRFIHSYIFRLTTMGRLDLPEDLIQDIVGEWKAGSNVHYELEIPSTYADPGQGFVLISCMSEISPSLHSPDYVCSPTANLLTGKPAD